MEPQVCSTTLPGIKLVTEAPVFQLKGRPGMQDSQNF